MQRSNLDPLLLDFRLSWDRDLSELRPLGVASLLIEAPCTASRACKSAAGGWQLQVELQSASFRLPTDWAAQQAADCR